MSLETGTYPSDFVLTNPTSGDPKSQGDDHLRLIKTCVQNALPVAAPVYPLTFGTAVSASGTAVNFTSIPSWVQRVTLTLHGVSTSGTDALLVQIGDSGGIEATGYSGASGAMAQASTTAVTSYTTGWGLLSIAASNLVYGSVVIEKVTSTAWVARGSIANPSAPTFITTAGGKVLTGTLDRVRLTTTGGANTFDNGTVNILYE